MGFNGSNSDRASIITDAEWALIAERLGLTPRQVQIAQAFIAGHGKPEAIAAHLGIEPSTVKTHIERMYARLGVHDRVDVVVTVFVQLMDLRRQPEPSVSL